MEALEIIAVLAELGAVFEGIKAAIDIVEDAKAHGHTHLSGEVLARVRTAMMSGVPEHSVLEPPRIDLSAMEPMPVGQFAQERYEG